MPELAYMLGGELTRAQLEREVDAIWREISTDPDLREEAARAGIDPDEVGRIRREDAIEIEKRSAGFGPETIIVAFLPVAITIARDAWKKIILPKLEQRYGVGAVAARKKRSPKAKKS